MCWTEADESLLSRVDHALNAAQLTPLYLSKVGNIIDPEERKKEEQYLLDLRYSEDNAGFFFAKKLLQRQVSSVRVAGLTSAERITEQSSLIRALEEILSKSEDVIKLFNSYASENVESDIGNLRFFWAINTIIALFPLPAGRSMHDGIYDALLSWLDVMFFTRGVSAAVLAAHQVVINTSRESTQSLQDYERMMLPPEFMLRKHAQAIVVGIQIFYPHAWRGVFSALFDMTSRMKMLFEKVEKETAFQRNNENKFLSILTHFLRCLLDSINWYVLLVFECIDERIVCNIATNSVVPQSSEIGGRIGSPTVSGTLPPLSNNGAFLEKSKEQRIRDMEIKDSMRESTVKEMVNMCYCVAHTYENRDNNHGITGESYWFSESILLSLRIIELYVDWIDINFILTDDWMNLIKRFMTVNVTHALSQLNDALSAEYRGNEMLNVNSVELELKVALGVTELLRKIVEKKQLSRIKYETLVLRIDIKSLCLQLCNNVCSEVYGYYSNSQVVQFLRSCKVSSIHQTLGELFPAFTTLVITVLNELCVVAAPEARRKAQLPPTDDEQMGSAELIHMLFSCAFRVFANVRDNLQVRETVFSLVHQLIRGDLLIQDELWLVLQLLFEYSIYPQNSNGVDILSEAASLESVDNEQEDILPCWIEQRRVIFNLIRQQFKTNEGENLVIRHLTSVVNQICTATQLPQELSYQLESWGNNMLCEADLHSVADYLGSSASASDCESVIRYIYEIYEAFRSESANKTPLDPRLTQLFGTVLYSNLCYYPHPAVHLALFELYDRYCSFFLKNSEGNIDVLLKQFLLLPCGICNSNSRVRSRICYLFSHMIIQLYTKLQDKAVDIARAVLVVVERCEVNSGPGGCALDIKEKSDLFEVLGTLLASKEAKMCETLISNLINHLISLFQGNTLSKELGKAAAERIVLMAALTKGSYRAIRHLQGGPSVMPEGMSPLTRGQQESSNSFGSFSGYTQYKDVVGLIKAMMQTVIETTKPVLPCSPELRDSICSLMHHVVNALESSAADVTIAFAETMLAAVQDVTEVTRVIRVVTQFASKARGDSAEPLGRILLPFITKAVQRFVKPISSLRDSFGVVSELVKENAEAYRAYFDLFLAVVSGPSCAESLLLNETRDCVLPYLMKLLTDATETSVELELPKQALHVLGCLARLWVAPSAQEYAKQPHALFPAVHGPEGEPQLPQEAAAVSSTFEELIFSMVIPGVLQFLVRTKSPQDEIGSLGVTPVDLSDGKFCVFFADLCAFMKLIVLRSGEPGLCKLYSVFSEVTAETQESFAACALLQEECQNSPNKTAVSAAVKNKFRMLITEAQKRNKTL